MATYKAEAIVMPNGDEFVPDENVFVAEYGVTTYAELEAAQAEGKALFCCVPEFGFVYPLTEFEGDFYFSIVTGNREYWRNCALAGWTNGGQTVLGCTTNNTITPSSSYFLPVTRGINETISKSTIQFGNATTSYLSNKGTWQSIPVLSVNGSTGDVNGLQTTANLVTSVSSASTDSQYPSAKLFYDTVGDIETLLAAI